MEKEIRVTEIEIRILRINSVNHKTGRLAYMDIRECCQGQSPRWSAVLQIIGVFDFA